MPNSKDSIVSKLALLYLISIGMFYMPIANAATANLGTMLENFAQTIPQFMRLVTAFAYVMGMYLVFKSVMGLKQYGEQRTQMSSSHELKGPLITMAVGASLLYLPSAVEAGLSTFWTNPNPYGYLDRANDQWSELIKNCFTVVQLVGVIAFIRGLLVLNKASGHGGQQDSFGKGMAHVIGGVLAINLNQFITAIENTLFLGQI